MSENEQAPAPELGEGAEAVMRWSLDRCRAELAHATKWAAGLEEELETARKFRDDASVAVRLLERMLRDDAPEVAGPAPCDLPSGFAVETVVYTPGPDPRITPAEPSVWNLVPLAPGDVWNLQPCILPPPEPHPLAPKWVTKPSAPPIADLKTTPLAPGFVRRVLAEVANHCSVHTAQLQWRHKVLAARVIRSLEPARPPNEVAGALGISPSSTAPSQLALAGWTEGDLTAVAALWVNPRSPTPTAEPGENDPISERKLAKARELIRSGKNITAVAAELDVSKRALHAALHPVAA